MKTILLFPLIIINLVSFAQTAINKSVAVQPGQIINMHFDYPDLIRVSTWDKNEISIQGTVRINGGENDEAFVLDTNTSGNAISITSEIKGVKNLPQRITVEHAGKKIVFKTKADFQKYCNEHGRDYNSFSTGVDMDIVLEIKVPHNIATRIESVYGIVEVNKFTGPLVVEATCGGVDVALQEKSIGELIAETNFGQIYSNLDIKLSGDNIHEKDFNIYVSAKPGNGPRYSFESKYGNVYLRKAIN